VLQDVDVIAAEDTRHSRKLLTQFNINTAMVAYHDHNERAQSERLVGRLEAGEHIALISDAGTPLISDPGYRLVNAAHEARIPVIPVPGPNAAVAALSAAGLPSDRFVFEGFLPAKAGVRRRRLQELAPETRTLVFYESPHRISASLTDMAAVLGGQRLALLARELTKRFETLRRDRLTTLVEWVTTQAEQRKGEFVVVVAGAANESPPAAQDEETVLRILLEYLPTKKAAEAAARVLGGKKNALYQLALKLIED